jgi:hypothetical protein
MRFVVACLAFLSSAAAAGIAGEPARVPLYTDEDLERVHPYRDQTGVASVPAVTPSAHSAGACDPQDRSRARAEVYWRREARRHRARQAALAARIAVLQRQIETRRRKSSRSRGLAEPSEALDDKLRALAEQRRDEDSAFEDRARRAGALPGWLRED